MCGVRDIWVLWYVCRYKLFHGFRPQDGYFSSIYIFIQHEYYSILLLCSLITPHTLPFLSVFPACWWYIGEPAPIGRWPCGLWHCHWLLADSHHWGPALKAMWCMALPLTARCLSPLRACPDGRVVYGIATDCSLSLTTEGLPWWPCGLWHCHWLLAVSHHWGPALMAVWSMALQLTARCLSPLRACPDGRVVYGIATDCSLSLTTEGLPWSLCGQRSCHWLLAVSHHCPGFESHLWYVRKLLVTWG